MPPSYGLGVTRTSSDRFNSVSQDARPHDHEDRPIDFGRTAIDYEIHRPGFPVSFFDQLEDRGWIRDGQRAVDLGTGTGSLALGFAARGLSAVGLDISSELLAVARQTAVDRNLTIEFVEARAEATGLPEASFDVVSAGQAWWWFDEEAALREVLRVLAPAGRLLICSFSYVPLPTNVAGRTEALILRHNPGWTKAGWPGIHPEQVQTLDRRSFSDVESFSYVTEVPFTHDAWRGRIRTCNGVGSALEAGEVERFDHDLAELLRTEFPGPLTVPHRVFAASGIKP